MSWWGSSNYRPSGPFLYEVASHVKKTTIPAIIIIIKICNGYENIDYKFINLQDDIDKLVKWSEKWQMLFNFGKCKCLHTGPGNTGMNYKMGGTILSKTVKEKDLGVSMNANMKVSEQCRIAASKGNQVLGMIRRDIYIYIILGDFSMLYRMMVCVICLVTLGIRMIYM